MSSMLGRQNRQFRLTSRAPVKRNEGKGPVMKRMLLIGLVSAMGTMLTVTRSVAADLITVDGAKLQTMMADGKPMVIVDVREPELFAKGHIKKAINIPYDGAKPRV